MPELTEDQLDERARRLVQIRHSEPTELTGTDLEAIATAHHDWCVRMAAAELLTARRLLVEMQQRVSVARAFLVMPGNDENGCGVPNA